MIKDVSTGSKVSCNNCHEKDNSANGYCKQCSQFLCPECLCTHNGWQPFLTHEIISVQELADNAYKLLPLNEDGDMKCNNHKESLKAYCETCQELICRDCTFSQSHKNHRYELITECYPGLLEEIGVSLTSVKMNVADINIAVSNLMSREREVTKQGEDIKKDIHAQAEVIIDVVQQSERQLLQQVDTVVQQKIQLITKQRDEAERALSQLRSCEEFIEQSLIYGSQQQVLGEKQQMVQHMEVLNQNINPIVFQPIEEATITFITYADKYDGIGKLEYGSFGKPVLTRKPCYVGKKSTTLLNLQSHDGSPFSIPTSLMSCEFSSPQDGEYIAYDINETQSGNYDITFTPHNEGNHDLTVQLGGINIFSSPITIPVTPSPEMKGKIMKIIPELNMPHGVNVTENGEIIISEFGADCITVLNKEGRKMRSFGIGTKKFKGEFFYPCGVALSNDGHILVTDENQIQKLTFEGECVMTVGKPGSDILQFNTPRGIAVLPTTGQIFIADTSNHRIQVLNNNFTYSHSFGKNGSSGKQFNSPYDVTFDNEGCLCVADFGNNCIKRFTTAGQYVSKIGSRQLKKPTSIAVDVNNLIYVTEIDSNRISLFDINGHFIHCFGNYGGDNIGEFNRPCGITVDVLGHVYVSDTWNNRLVVL